MATKKTKLKKSSNRDNLCKFCSKGFSSEKTLISHLCPKKKRYADKDTPGARLGFRAFQRFFELTTQSKTPKSEMDFIQSPYYIAFVKFGRYLIDLHPLSPEEFTDFLIKNAIPLKSWCVEAVYEKHLSLYTKKEPACRAAERSIVTMTVWADENNDDYNNFFKHVHPVEATHLIRSGHISPWVLYLAESGQELFDRLNDEQAKLISNVIDPDYWQDKMLKKKDDVVFIRTILKGANI